MNYALPAVEEYQKLLPVARQLYDHTSRLTWEMLLPVFLVSIALSYTSDLGLTGAILVRLRRLVLVALLLVSFPMIAEFTQILGVEIAKSIDDMSGIDMVLEAASKRADAYSLDLTGLLNFGAAALLMNCANLSFVIEKFSTTLSARRLARLFGNAFLIRLLLEILNSRIIRPQVTYFCLLGSMMISIQTFS